jgi:hypothetical protein
LIYITIILPHTTNMICLHHEVNDNMNIFSNVPLTMWWSILIRCTNSFCIICISVIFTIKIKWFLILCSELTCLDFDFIIFLSMVCWNTMYMRYMLLLLCKLLVDVLFVAYVNLRWKGYVIYCHHLASGVVAVGCQIKILFSETSWLWCALIGSLSYLYLTTPPPLHSRWPLLPRIEISLNVHYCFVLSN